MTPEARERPRIVLVAAVARNGVIGAGGGIPWRLPEDFAHFKRVTAGHSLVMGRATYDSIGRPLPGRPSIVITRDRSWRAEGVEVAHSLPEALELAVAHGPDVAIVGGAGVYAEALPLATHQILSEVHQEPEGDTFYPEFDRDEWRETYRIPGPEFDRVWWERVGREVR